MKRTQFQSALQRCWSIEERRAARTERLLRSFWIAPEPTPVHPAAGAAPVIELSAARRRAR